MDAMTRKRQVKYSRNANWTVTELYRSVLKSVLDILHCFSASLEKHSFFWGGGGGRGEREQALWTWKHGHAPKETDTHTHTQTHTCAQTDRETDKRTDLQTDKHTYAHTRPHTPRTGINFFYSLFLCYAAEDRKIDNFLNFFFYWTFAFDQTGCSGNWHGTR